MTTVEHQRRWASSNLLGIDGGFSQVDEDEEDHHARRADEGNPDQPAVAFGPGWKLGRPFVVGQRSQLR